MEDSSTKKEEDLYKKETIGISTEVIENFIDEGLLGYNFHSGFSKDIKTESMFFDSTGALADLPINKQGLPDLQGLKLGFSNRYITFNIPLIDNLSRSNPFVRKASNYLASKPIINGIDINIDENSLSSEELFILNDKIKKLYPSIKEISNKGLTYGGSGGLIWFDGETITDLEKPLIISKIKKGSFKGLKPLVRWFQIEPALDKELIQFDDIGEHTGINDARYIGLPKYYYVNFSGALVGNFERKDAIVHTSRLVIYINEMPSYIETQIERYWSPSLIEVAWNDLVKDKRLWDATTKSAEKNNMGILKIDGLNLAGTLNTNVKNQIKSRISMIKEGSSHNILPMSAKDSFEFVSSVLSGQSEVIKLNNERLAGAFGVPPSVLFPHYEGDKEDRAYTQSLSILQDIQERIIRPMYEKIIPIIIKSEFNKTIKNVMFTFNPIETQTLKEKAEMAKIMSDTFNILYNIGWADKASGIKMLDDIVKDPTNLAQNINKDFRKHVMENAKNGKFETSNSDKIEVAIALNHIQKENEGKGLSGVNNPESDIRGNDGGNPKISKRPLKRNVLDEELNDQLGEEGGE